MVQVKFHTDFSNFGDKRLNRRFGKIIESVSTNLNQSLPQACESKSQTKAAYNFFRHDYVDVLNQYAAHRSNLVSPIGEHLDQLASSGSVTHPYRLLCLSDTVELDYTGKRTASDLGPLNSPHRRGLFFHNDLLTNSLGVPLGLLHQQSIIRTDEDWGKSEQRKYDPIETKESYKWYLSFTLAQDFHATLSSRIDFGFEGLPTQANTTTAPHARDIEMVYIADREGDLNELFQARRTPGMHQLIRAQHNRVGLMGTNGKTIKVKAHLAALEVDAYQHIEILDPQTKKNKKLRLPSNTRVSKSN